MDSEFIESYLAVVEAGSIAEAARRQGLTASAVSQRLRALEADLDVALTVRAGRVVRPTPEAETLLPSLRALADSARAVRLARDAVRVTGRVRLGAIETVLTDQMPDILDRVRRDLPDVSLQIVPGASEHLYHALHAGEIEAAVIAAPPFDLPKALAFVPLCTRTLVHLQPVASTQDVPWIVYSRSAWAGPPCWRALTAMVGPNPEVLCEIDAPVTLARMVARGLGQAVVPRWPGLDEVPGLLVQELDAPGVTIGLILPAQWTRHPIVDVIKAAVTA